MGCGSSTTTFEECVLCIARGISIGYPKTLRIPEITDILRSVCLLRRLDRLAIDLIQFDVGLLKYSQETRRYIVGSAHACLIVLC